MARNQETVHIGSSWVEITGGAATVITFQIVSAEDLEADGIYVRVTADATAPTGSYGLLYRPNKGEMNIPLAELAVGQVGGARVWARSVNREAVLVFVSDDSA